MSDKVRHYLIIHKQGYWVSACGIMLETQPQDWTLFKNKTTCIACKKNLNYLGDMPVLKQLAREKPR